MLYFKRVAWCSFPANEFVEFLSLTIFKHSPKKLVNEIFFTFAAEAEIDDEGIERDSEDIDDEKFVDTKELDHVLEVSFTGLKMIDDDRVLFVNLGRKSHESMSNSMPLETH